MTFLKYKGRKIYFIQIEIFLQSFTYIALIIAKFLFKSLKI